MMHPIIRNEAYSDFLDMRLLILDYDFQTSRSYYVQNVLIESMLAQYICNLYQSLDKVS